MTHSRQINNIQNTVKSKFSVLSSTIEFKKTVNNQVILTLNIKHLVEKQHEFLLLTANGSSVSQALVMMEKKIAKI